MFFASLPTSVIKLRYIVITSYHLRAIKTYKMQSPEPELIHLTHLTDWL